jgi:hypothetical protein
MYEPCRVCGSLLPPDRRAGGRCPVCHARLSARDRGDVDPDEAGREGVVILAMLSGVVGALVGFVVALVFIC